MPLTLGLYLKTKTMKKNVVIFGLVMGAVLCIPWIIMVNMLYNNPEFKSNDFLGYAILVVIYSLIFVGIRNYRNKELSGIISFGKAFKTGALITLVAASFYVIAWLFCYYLFVPDFMEVFTRHMLYQCTSEADRAAKAIEMENYAKMYEQPLFVILLTYAEVIPIGLVVSLISALLLKSKRKKI
jgi:4-amino-4-deoxy-L-arabinose transferase-like glycosyltransferase